MFATTKSPSVASPQYQISRSLRFNSADSAYLNRSPTTSGSSTIWTYSAWFKRSLLGTNVTLISAANPTQSSSDFDSIELDSDKIRIYFQGSTSAFLVTTQVFRDVSAWYHIVVAVDTTQATSSNRIKLYINGSQVTTFSTSTYPSQNYATYFNISGRRTTIGATARTTTAAYFDGYQTEVNWIDGTQLTSSSFGEINTTTGVWQPKAFIGTYGTNGFYLNFSDNSNTTAATLGADYSGNGNNWTPNNFSVSAGAGNDSLVDSPTSYGTDTGAGGTVRGNYCTLNPLFTPTGGSIVTLTNGNLDAACSNSRVGFGTIQIPNTGKWYFEYVCTSFAFANYGIGKINATGGGNATGTFGFYQNGSNYEFHDGGATTLGSSSGIVSQTNDIGLICVDMDNGKIWMGRDRSGTVTWVGGGTPGSSSPTWSAAGQGGVYATNFDTTSNWFPIVSSGSNDTWSCNFGQRPFAYTAPSGFKALCTQNFSTPSIVLASQYYNAVLYTGTGSTLSVTGVGFQPDWVWVKGRSGATDHAFYDAVRGVQKQIESNTTTAETTETTGLTAFGSDGFTTGALAQMNTSAATYVAWNWKANGAGSTNTSGSITSTVSASATSGFSVVTYTGSGIAATIGHGLGITPSMIIVKSRSAAGAWPVYQSTLGNGSNLVLNTTAATATSSTIWNSTSPTSSVFSVGINTDSNTVTITYVAYCFAEVAGYSKFGSYTGNGSTDGPFVYTGMRPAYVMVKRTDSTSDWYIWDTKRDTYNVVTNTLLADTSGAETSATSIDDLSNGFKCRSATVVNASSGTYIYMAFAESPFKYSLAR